MENEKSDAVRNATASIAGLCKRLRVENRMDDQEYTLILAWLRKIENALIPGLDESEPILGANRPWKL